MFRTLKKLRSSQRPYIIAIESSCDDTCLAVLNEQNEIIREFKYSQKKLHQPFGGVVPQLASTGHRTSFGKCLQNSFLRDIIKYDRVKIVAITTGPGIGSCLNVGYDVATQIARSNNIPLLPTNHLLGHLSSVNLITKVEYPRVSLIVSGGNSQLIFSRSIEQHHIIGLTLDDALGEALDKCARLLNCGWAENGGLGVELEKLASKGKPHPLDMKALENYKDPLSFSFSGPKTAIKLFISDENNRNISKEDLAATIQETLFGHVIDRVKNCFEILKVGNISLKTFSLIGGVASNNYLRSKLDELCSKYGVKLVVPPPYLCTDNAVMIGVAANEILMTNSSKLLKNRRIDPEWSLEELSINKPSID